MLFFSMGRIGQVFPSQKYIRWRPLFTLEDLRLGSMCKSSDNRHVELLVNESSWMNFLLFESMAFRFHNTQLVGMGSWTDPRDIGPQ